MPVRQEEGSGAWVQEPGPRLQAPGARPQQQAQHLPWQRCPLHLPAVAGAAAHESRSGHGDLMQNPAKSAVAFADVFAGRRRRRAAATTRAGGMPNLSFQPPHQFPSSTLFLLQLHRALPAVLRQCLMELSAGWVGGGGARTAAAARKEPSHLLFFSAWCRVAPELGRRLLRVKTMNRES